MVDHSIKTSIVLFWLAVIMLYPMLISIYVVLPLFIGFAGLMFIIGLEKEKFLYTLFSAAYMINLEINLSLPLFLLLISTMIFYLFFSKKLLFIKLCRVCVYIVTVVAINMIYLLILGAYDTITQQHSINYDGLILVSVVYDIIAAVLL